MNEMPKVRIGNTGGVMELQKDNKKTTTRQQKDTLRGRVWFFFPRALQKKENLCHLFAVCRIAFHIAGCVHMNIMYCIVNESLSLFSTNFVDQIVIVEPRSFVATLSLIYAGLYLSQNGSK
jgi:hypothetical protein